MSPRVQAFYRQFFDYALSEADAHRMLQGQPPAPGGGGAAGAG